MSVSKEFDDTWDDIYDRGKQMNLYPYDSIVSFLMRRYGRPKQPSRIKVLEIGCGAGNNLWFAAREGFEVTGLDASESAISFARQRFTDDSLIGTFDVGSFTSLPYTDQAFDVVIDRAASTNVNLATAKKVVAEVHRVLKNRGVFYSEVFSDHASSRGHLLDDGVLTNIEGPYSGAGHIYFYGRKELEKMYAEGWTVLDLTHTERKQYLSNGTTEVFAHWSISVEKSA